MDYNILNVKDFLRNDSPQFDVILRHENGESVNMEFGSDSEELDFNFKEEIKPESPEQGVIKIVRRAFDAQILRTGDWVECEEGSCFILRFYEDKIHCDVITVDEKNGRKITIEVEEIIFVASADDIDDDDLIDIEL